MDEIGCTCVSKYECCSKTCGPLSDKDWKLCENPKKYGVGKYYPFGTEDCCDCPTVICLPCMEIVLGKPENGAGKFLDEMIMINDMIIIVIDCNLS